MLSILERFFAEPERVEAEAHQLEQDRAGTPRTDPAPPRYRCRVCALESDQGSYCATCLADTMVLLKKTPA